MANFPTLNLLQKLTEKLKDSEDQIKNFMDKERLKDGQISHFEDSFKKQTKILELERKKSKVGFIN